MGSYFHVDVGVYIECVECVYKPKNILQNANGCNNIKCINNGLVLNSAYCPDCGKKCDIISISQTKEICTFELEDELEEKFTHVYTGNFDKNIHYYVSNITPLESTLREYFFSQGMEDSVLDLTSISPKEEIDKFKKIYSKELNIFSKHYKIVNVKWGIINRTY